MRHSVSERKSILLLAANTAFHRVAINSGHQRTTTAATPMQSGTGETLELHPIIPCPQPSTVARLRPGPTVALSTMAAACGSALCGICRPGPSDPRRVHITVFTPPCAHFGHTLCAPPCAHPRHTLCTLCAHFVHTPVCTLRAHVLGAHPPCAHFVHTLCTLCAHPRVHTMCC